MNFYELSFQPAFSELKISQILISLLRFYAKIGQDFYCYRIRNVHKSTLNLECASHVKAKHYKKQQLSHGCRATAKVKVNAALIKLGKPYIRTDGRPRSNFQIDFENPLCLDEKSYEIVTTNSGNHIFSCKKTFFDPLHVDFRHDHIQSGLAIKAPAWTQTVQNYRLRERFGADFQAKVIGDKKCEMKAFYRKLSRTFQNCAKTDVPIEYRQIERTDFENNFGIFRENWQSSYHLL